MEQIVLTLLPTEDREVIAMDLILFSTVVTYSGSCYMYLIGVSACDLLAGEQGVLAEQEGRGQAAGGREPEYLA